MSESDYFKTLSHVMWDMNVDIFLEKEKTLGLVGDFSPKSKKQINRLRAMYKCGAMDKIASAIGDKSNYAEYMWNAVDLIKDELQIDEKKAVFAVNQIISLWNGELPELDDSDEGDENMDASASTEEKKPESEKSENKPEEKKENQAPDILKKVIHFWCFSNCEQDRPLMIACPIGWIYILICSALGIFLVYDIPLGDIFVPPVFVFMYVVLLSKRLYRFESVGRFSLLIAFFYVAAAARALFVGSYIPVRGVFIVLTALIVFNNGRFSELLDGEKRNPWLAYFLITLMSATVTAGVYAIQNVRF